MKTIPKEVKDAARLGLKLHDMGYKGGTSVGWNRAKELLSETFINEITEKEMKAWLARHKKTSYPGYVKWVKKGQPMDGTNKTEYRGAVAWLLWGGDAAYSWLR